ncbi:hypothetical protein GCM10011357_06470 [Lacimicrobium alkaliphilum]|uniref:Uncharacterized protein n=1 Tax=Lacimicrobium alkaliphilum TaxID=1526571 RepID=A0ABQ1R3I2_9ALTE|nr:hypothetical protein GCM10011357_06470 [Lacimicrobium alkaliphilum]
MKQWRLSAENNTLDYTAWAQSSEAAYRAAGLICRNCADGTKKLLSDAIVYSMDLVRNIKTL